MTTPIAERVAKPSHGRALSGHLSYSDDRQLRCGRRRPDFTQITQEVAPNESQKRPKPLA
jgi:hypothetical protein